MSSATQLEIPQKIPVYVIWEELAKLRERPPSQPSSYPNQRNHEATSSFFTIKACSEVTPQHIAILPFSQVDYKGGGRQLLLR